MEILNALVALACIIGVVGAIVQVYPGLLIVTVAVATWGVVTGGSWGWGLFVVALIVLALASVGTFLLAGKRLKRAGVANSSMLLGGAFAVVGFFVVPVIGAILGFVLGVYLGEAQRSRSRQRAWDATVQALKSVGLAILVELFASLALSVGWALIAFLAV